MVLGNLRQILHRDGWGFIQHLTDTYPGIAKLHGAFGVRLKHPSVAVGISLRLVCTASYSVRLRPRRIAPHRSQGSTHFRGALLDHEVSPVISQLTHADYELM